MQKTTLRSTSLTATAFFLIGTLAVAQAPSTARKKLPGRMKSGQIVLTKAPSDNGSGATTPLSTQATQRKDGAVIGADYDHQSNARSSAHATEGKATSDVVQERKNPLYEDSGKSGSNPMYESGKEATVKPNSSTSGAAGYKDPEDMTTRKQGVKEKMGPDHIIKKHIAGVKYEDITAAKNNSSSSKSDTGSGKQ